MPFYQCLLAHSGLRPSIGLGPKSPPSALELTRSGHWRTQHLKKSMAAFGQHDDEKGNALGALEAPFGKTLSIGEDSRRERQLRAHYLDRGFIIGDFKRGNLATEGHQNCSREKDE